MFLLMFLLFDLGARLRSPLESRSCRIASSVRPGELDCEKCHKRNILSLFCLPGDQNFVDPT